MRCAHSLAHSLQPAHCSWGGRESIVAALLFLASRRERVSENQLVGPNDKLLLPLGKAQKERKRAERPINFRSVRG
jgi:hypothetical protein